MQCRRDLGMRILSVRLYVCLSVKGVLCDKTVERSVQIYIWLVVGDPFNLKFYVNRPPLERNRRFSTNNRS